MLIHSIEVESCRFEILNQGYEPVVHVRTGNLGRKRYAGNVFAGRIMLAATPSAPTLGQLAACVEYPPARSPHGRRVLAIEAAEDV